MSYDALVIPRERPPDLIEIKRALLSFDRVVIFERDDREVIPPAALMMAASGGLMPIGLQGHAVMPLGRAPAFDEEFEEVQAAIEFGKAEGIIDTIIPPPDVAGRLFIGSVPLGPDTPNPTFVLSVLRHLATDQALLNASISTAVPLSGLSDAEIEVLTPDGSGHQEINTLPSPVTYSGPVESEEHREAVTRLARARLGSVVRSLSIAHNKHLHPITEDQGLANVVETLVNRLEGVARNSDVEETERALLDRLGRLHRIVMKDFVDDAALRTCSLEDILRARNASWGLGQEHRRRLLTDLREIAFDEPSASTFDARCRSELEAYQRTQAQIAHEWTNLRLRVECGLGALLTGAGSGVMQRILGTGSLETLLVLGGVLFAVTGEYLPAVRDRLKAERDLKASAGYGLATPYRALLGRAPAG